MATVYYTASTIDGFIATPEHGLEWLLSRDIDQAGPMNYQSFAVDVGALVMGSHTFEWIIEHEPGQWLYDQPTWVFTSRDLTAPDGADVRFVNGDVREVHAVMTAAAGDRNVWVVGGGRLAADFAAAGLLDQVWVQWAPVALGSGAPLMPRHLELALEDVARNRDFVCARYSVVR